MGCARRLMLTGSLDAPGAAISTTAMRFGLLSCIDAATPLQGDEASLASPMAPAFNITANTAHAVRAAGRARSDVR
jgi:hypothetical protein